MEEVFKFIKKHVYLTLCGIFVAIICGVLAMSFYADKELQKNGRQQFYEKFASIAADYENDNNFDKNLILALAKNLQGDSYADRCQKIEQMGSTMYETYKLFGVADKNGKVHTSHTDDYYLGDRDFFRSLKDGQNDVIESDSNNYTPDGKCKVLYTLAKLKDAAGNFDGAVFLAEEANKAMDVLDLTFFEKEVTAFLIRADGQVVAYRGQNFNTDNLLTFLQDYSQDCKNIVQTMHKDFAIDAKGMVVCDYADGATIAYYPIESIGREKMDFLVFIMPDELLLSGINAAMSRLNKYLALGVIIVMMLVGYVLYIYLQMNAKIENLSYVSDITRGPNLAALRRTLTDEGWTDFYLVVMKTDGYYKTLRHRGLKQMRRLMGKIWHNMAHEFVREDVRIAHVHSHYFVFAIRKDRQGVCELLDRITKDMIKFCQVNNAGVLFPYFGVTHMDSINQDITGYLGNIVSLVVSHDFKHESKNYVFWEEEKEVLDLKGESLLSYFEKAVNSHAFELKFQAKRDKSNKLVGGKIFSVWKLGDGRVLDFDQFFGMLSRQGLLPRLDMMNFRLVCTQLRKWKEMGKKLLPISAYLSDSSFYQEDLVKSYKMLADVAGVDPKYIQFEISESSLSSVPNIHEILKEFKDAGFTIILGGFVNGVSGLVNIKGGIIEYLSLGTVTDWTDNANGLVVCQGIVNMAKKIGLKVILSRINSEERLQKVKELDYDEMVGSYFEKSMSADDFAKLLEQGEAL